ncbi:hypothetical protein P872_23545 [Rhodonellum psychrophilum GCM71 = DSM 17998]|uniref:Uncharacterized protein n=2 Tax=Rhodonellum TaxID=336827 RepID=U5C8Z4_9BACT|nr:MULTISPECIES: DUF6544 family protein [Rhodonellum]ERM84687.1 hypothetical protein P872_23545 [Rhodonellum psychrophilum GCM71 = DSM 17998]SDZ13231.1 hypothetical protein SAMN05444412_106122 [Rhodonellum ikkaensis]
MKIILFIILFLHGAIHLLGFLKAFGISEIGPLSAEISRPMGLVWLLVTVLFLVAGILSLLNVSWWIHPALIAVMLSSFLMVFFWADTKYGMIPNLIILSAVILAYSSDSFYKKIARETSEILATINLSEQTLVSEDDLKNLPAPVSKWMHITGIMGKPKIKSGRIVQHALMKMKQDQKDWYHAAALQYTTTEEPAFIWTVNLNMMPGIHIKGRDKFENGTGEMLIKMNSLVKIVDEKGEKINEGSLQRFLGESVWFPSLALSPYIKWKIIDNYSAKATMTYKGTSGSGVFYYNEQGDFVKFIAMRYQGNKPDSKTYPWVLTVDEYSVFEGIKVPSRMKATWELETGSWTWLDLEIKDIQYNVHGMD